MQFACFYSSVFSAVPTASHCLCDGEYFIATRRVREESLPSVINSCNERCSDYKSVPDTRAYLVHLQAINRCFFLLVLSPFFPSSPTPFLQQEDPRGGCPKDRQIQPFVPSPNSSTANVSSASLVGFFRVCVGSVRGPGGMERSHPVHRKLYRNIPCIFLVKSLKISLEKRPSVSCW